MKLLKEHLNFPAAIWGLIIISLYTVLSVDFNAFKIPELFEGGHKFQNLFYQISLGVIVSMPLYYILIYRQEVKAKKAFTIFLSFQIKLFYTQVASLMTAMAMNQQKIGITFKLPSDAEIEDLFNNSKPTDPSNLFDGAQTTLSDQLIELLDHFENMETKIAIRSRGIDPELDAHLTKVSRSAFFFSIRNSRSRLHMNNDFSLLGKSFIMTLHPLKELSEYCTKEYGIQGIYDFINAKQKTLA
jgi:hypothetical protein